MKPKSHILVSHDRNTTARQTASFGMLQREIEHLFDDFGRCLPGFGSSQLMPHVDVTETDKIIELTAELPGLEENDVEIICVEGALTIRGEKGPRKNRKTRAIA